MMLQVVLYNANLTNLNNLTGSQIGAYFGYCLATADINGDGLDDLIIGKHKNKMAAKYFFRKKKCLLGSSLSPEELLGCTLSEKKLYLAGKPRYYTN